MTKRRSILAFFALGLIVYSVAASRLGWIKSLNTQVFIRPQPGSYAIKRFVDGDTIVVDMNGTPETIRFIGVDTPETHKPNTPVQCYGPAAAAYTKNRIGTERVRLISDNLTTNRDRYNRLLRYVYLEDGVNLNLELVQKGYAFAYAFPFAKKQEFFAAMYQARNSHTGLWGNCAPYQDSSTGQWHTPAQ